MVRVRVRIRVRVRVRIRVGVAFSTVAYAMHPHHKATLDTISIPEISMLKLMSITSRFEKRVNPRISPA